MYQCTHRNLQYAFQGTLSAGAHHGFYIIYKALKRGSTSAASHRRPPS
jgi:hypothetical protein